MKIVLYGAGKRGRQIYSLLEKRKGMDVFCFCDKRASEIKELQCGNKNVPVISYEQLRTIKDCKVLICIVNKNQANEVAQMLEKDNISYDYTKEEFFMDDCGDVVKRNRDFVAKFHEDYMNEYFDEAESKESLNKFWLEEGEFYPFFKQLDLTNVVELACGRGRHVQKYSEQAGNIILVDILQKNIDFCKERFSNQTKINYYVNNGFDLSEIPSESQTSVFTYDAMVHFELLDIFNYLKETYRILKVGGMGLFHHSNNHTDYKGTFFTSQSGRNYMSAELFAYLANRAELEVVSQKIIDWSIPNLDCITLVRKNSF